MVIGVSDNYQNYRVFFLMASLDKLVELVRFCHSAGKRKSLKEGTGLCDQWGK